MFRLQGAVAFLVLLAVETCQFSGVPSSHFGTFDFLELENAVYEVEISSAPVSELQLHQNAQKEESDVMYMPMLSKHGQLYSCSIPPPLEEKEQEEELLAELLPNVTALLKPLRESECLIKTVGWWTYEYCHEMFVRQYHQEAGRIMGETKYLGFYEKETVWDQSHITRVKGLLDSFKDNLAGSQAQAYHSAYYINGTECDITRQPRTAKVEFYCTVGGVDKMVEVKEESTCNYTLRIHTPLLCQHPILRPLKNPAPSHTLSCSPVVSQLDYEDYLLKEELIRQQKEKLIALESSSDKRGEEKGGSLSNDDHKLLRQLVMSSITQLAEIAYDVGSAEDQGGYDSESDLDTIDDDDKEVRAGSPRSDKSKNAQRSNTLGRERSREREPVGPEVRVHRGVGAEEVEKVSDKMKKMADDVKSTGKDSALESLLANLAVTAQYIESLENEGEDSSSPKSETAKDASDTLEGHQERYEDGERLLDGATSDGDTTVKGPPVVERGGTTGGTSVNGEDAAMSQSEVGRTERQSISSEILAASGLEGVDDGKREEGEGEEFELDPELVREVEKHLEEALAKQLDTKDVTVKIFTLSEDQLQEEGREGVTTFENSDGDLTNSMSRLLDSLLNDEEPESEDRQRQYNLEDSYHHVWGKDRRKRGSK